MKTIEIIQDEVAKHEFYAPWNELTTYSQKQIWPEVCKRYAIEVAKASLEKASENVRINFDTVAHKKFITDEQNIVL